MLGRSISTTSLFVQNVDHKLRLYGKVLNPEFLQIEKDKVEGKGKMCLESHYFLAVRSTNDLRLLLFTHSLSLRISLA